LAQDKILLTEFENQMDRFSLAASDGEAVACYSWVPEKPIAIVQIAHGMGEHAARYDRLAGRLTAEGYAVYASDHRGHGETSGPALGYMGADGWNRALADMYELNLHARHEHPGLKLALVGHSMGSMLAQQYITRYGCSIDVLALSGSPGFKDTRFGFITRWILRFEAWRQGAEGQSELMQQKLFGDANTPYDGPDATGSEWLSRDADEVRKYVADPKCGFVLTPGSLIDMYQGSGVTQSAEAIAKIPVDLPMYIFSGSDDAVHGEKLDIERMVAAYKAHGMKDLTFHFYPEGRHEMFNETNREEVTQDLVNWLKEHLS
jgi:alpha-beta hydrolase superfamily lysophospholipase